MSRAGLGDSSGRGRSRHDDSIWVDSKMRVCVNWKSKKKKKKRKGKRTKFFNKKNLN